MQLGMVDGPTWGSAPLPVMNSRRCVADTQAFLLPRLPGKSRGAFLTPGHGHTGADCARTGFLQPEEAKFAQAPKGFQRPILKRFKDSSSRRSGCSVTTMPVLTF